MDDVRFAKVESMELYALDANIIFYIQNLVICRFLFETAYSDMLLISDENKIKNKSSY